MADVLGKCSEVIRSTISGRIRELGGTDRDVRQIVTSAAYAIFEWSAGQASPPKPATRHRGTALHSAAFRGLFPYRARVWPCGAPRRHPVTASRLF
jgi:hypothetical protein